MKPSRHHLTRLAGLSAVLAGTCRVGVGLVRPLTGRRTPAAPRTERELAATA